MHQTVGIFFVSYGLDTTSTLEHVADTFRFYFFDPKHSRPAEIPLFLRVSWCSLFFIRDLSEIFLDAHVETCSCFRDARGKFHDGRLERPRKRWNSIAGHQEWKADVRFWNNFLNVFCFVFNETGKGYGTQFERHRLEIVFVIESSAWLCLFCRWDQFLLCPRLTHSWCFSGVSKTTTKTTTTATTGSYIFFIWRDQFVLCSGLRLLHFFMKRSWFCRQQQQFLYRHSPVSLWQTAAYEPIETYLGSPCFLFLFLQKLFQTDFRESRMEGIGEQQERWFHLVDCSISVSLCFFFAPLCVLCFFICLCVFCQIMRGYAWEFANHLTGWFFLLVTPKKC